MAAVKDRLTKEIAYWDHHPEELKVREAAGRQPRMNWQRARQRADDLQARLQRRMTELEQERHLSPLPPVVIGGALIVPAGLLARLQGQSPQAPDTVVHDTERIERLAMAAVMTAERRLGCEPRDVSPEKRGYDIESRVPGTGRLRFLEVKGRMAGAQTVTIQERDPHSLQLTRRLHPGGGPRGWGDCHAAVYPPPRPARAGFRGDECELRSG
jgi:Domain of unknown function (DUF3883)